ncbi:MAG: hypothetical protein EHM41_11465, partial [Chloroflexi bacterium]
IFEQALPVTERIYLTRVDASVDADTYFPLIEADEWEEKLVSSYPADEKNDFPHTFSILEKINTQSKNWS